jgi:hypothetical protein
LEDGKPNKKVKTSQGRPTMPASWRLDPDTQVYVWDKKEQVWKPRPVVCCPFIRRVDISTMERGDKTVFISDDVSAFSMAKPVEFPVGRAKAAWR